ncbi:MAG: hypothetical protein HY529_01930 [Chloroflexi bacterium]|nr:hypothetical protein [Chloroflexota bacterium]
MLEIECLVCGKTIRLPPFIDTANYDGQIACRECASLMQVKLVGEMVRKYKVVEKGLSSQTAVDDKPAATTKRSSKPEPEKQTREEVDVDNIARYNPLRDYLASYKASQLKLTFKQIESIIDFELEKGAHTFKSWWENDSKHAQAFAWLEAGWQVSDVDLTQRNVTLRRQP